MHNYKLRLSYLSTITLKHIFDIEKRIIADMDDVPFTNLVFSSMQSKFYNNFDKPHSYNTFIINDLELDLLKTIVGCFYSIYYEDNLYLLEMIGLDTLYDEILALDKKELTFPLSNAILKEDQVSNIHIRPDVADLFHNTNTNRKEQKVMVTRTMSTTTITVLCLDITTAEPSNETVTVSGTIKDTEKALKIAKAKVDTDTLKAVSVVDITKEEELYCMEDEDFLAHAKKIPPRKKYEKE